MEKKKFLISILFILFCALVCFGQNSTTQVTGTIDYLEGIVDVHRDGEILDWTMVDIGFDLEQFDLLETGSGGYAEIIVESPSSSGNLVRVRENTAFYLDFEEKGDTKETRLKMLTGSLAVKVQKVTGVGEVTVQTESAVMGVRGTEFTVTAAPEGSILVTCETGRVSCSDDAGREFFAVPGNAVEKTRDSTMRDLSIDIGDIEMFRQQWIDQKIDNFIPNSSLVMKSFVETFVDRSDRFNSAYNELMKHSSVFKRWERDIDAGRSVSSAVTDKIQVSPAIFKMRSNLFIFEHSYYRIKGLDRIYKDYNIPSFRIHSGYSLDDFFRDFEKSSRNFAWKLSQVRYIFKLYAKMDWSMSGGSGFPGGDSMMDDIFSGSDPFGGERPF
jgi:hypothetical protein